ncbi:MAG: DMT family transporter [Rhodospirillales bacterium]|nr:DMT family transporter [Rhodospirillales bacterium]
MTTIRSIANAFSRLPAAIQAPLWMIAATTLLGTMNVIVRHVSAELHPFEIAFFRNLGQLVFMLPWLMHVGLGAFHTKHFGLQVARAASGLVGMLVWFTALSLMPVAEATALSFTGPLFATVGAALILRERVGIRRWSATVIGFLGTLVIVRPGLIEFSYPTMVALASAATFAASALTLKSVSRWDQPSVTVFYMGLLLTPTSLIPALFVWEAPSLDAYLWFVALGLAAGFAHLCLSSAYMVADASVNLPFDFFRLPAAATMAYFMFGEVPDIWTWVGAAIIFSATVYIARREAKLALKTVQALEPAIGAVSEPRIGESRNK